MTLCGLVTRMAPICKLLNQINRDEGSGLAEFEIGYWRQKLIFIAAGRIL